jgi:hypothetical protein
MVQHLWHLAFRKLKSKRRSMAKTLEPTTTLNRSVCSGLNRMARGDAGRLKLERMDACLLTLPPIDLLDQNLVGASSPQADLKPALIAFSLLLCMKNKQKPTKTYKRFVTGPLAASAR